MKCPSCGHESSGAYCSECGAPLRGARCRSCSAALPAGARFCTRCGEAVGGASRLPWYVAGAAVAGLAGVLLFLSFGPPGGPAAPPPARVPVAGPATAGGEPPPLSGSPREQADRLFNRIMEARTAGDTAQARFFLPMALQAYQTAGELDADGVYHLALLHLVGGDPAAALEAAESILQREPGHLLALGVAAEAAQAAGDTEAARGYHRRLLDAYDRESGRELREYLDHALMLPEYRAAAEEALAS